MLIQFGTIVTGATGSIGGITIARNANSAYARKKVKNVNPNTIAQQGRRNQFGSISRAWKSLTPAEQQSWNKAAPSFPYKNKLNISSTYTGAQLYSKFNNQLVAVGQTPLVTAPVGVSMSAIDIASAIYVSGAGTFIIQVLDTTLLTSTVPVGFTLVIGGTKPISKGITSPKKPAFRTITTVASAASMAAVSIEAAYVALFGLPNVATANVYIECWLVSNTTGQVGKKIQILAVA